jgi:hypothetical protein
MDAGIDSTNPKEKRKYAREQHTGHADPPDDWDGPSSATAQSCAARDSRGELEDELRDYIERLRDRAESHFENYKEGSTLDANFADAFNEVADELEQMIQ